MAEGNGFTEHKLLILDKLATLKQSQDETRESVDEVRAEVIRLKERMHVWSAVIGALFGAATSLVVMLVSHMVGK